MDIKDLGLDQDLVNAVARIVEASCSSKKMEKEELHPNQVKLDKNKNGKLDADDFKKLRGESKCDEEETDESYVSNAQRKAVWASKNEKGVKEAKDGWSQNDSLAKPVTSGQAMANYSQYFTKVTKLDSNGNPKKPEKLRKEETEDLDESEKFVNIATSKRAIADAEKALNDSPNMFHGAKTGFKRQITIHKKHIENASKNMKEETGDLDEAKDTLAAAVKRSEAARIRIEKKKEAMRKKGFDDEAIKKHFAEELCLEDYSMEELEDFMMSEDFEQLDELSKKALSSYVKSATGDLAHTSELRGAGSSQMAAGKSNKDIPNDTALYNKQGKRIKGIFKAVNKLTKEQVEEIEALAAKHGLGE